MGNLSSSIYIDYSRNMWKFELDENNNLCYKIMYEEGIWEKEIIIARNVLAFSVYINEDEIINIIYSNDVNEIKYCTMRDTKWVGKKVYKVEDEGAVLTNIKILINQEKMHIFFIKRNLINKGQGIINYCVWDGEHVENIVIQEIVLLEGLKEYYSIFFNNTGGIELFFLDDEGEEVTLNRCTLINNKWTSIRKLYGIQGNNIEFDIVLDKDETHIINKYKEANKFFLEYVNISIIDLIKEYKIHSSLKEPIDSRIIIQDKNIYCFWAEEDKIYYSYFKINKWSEAKTIDIEETTKIKGDNCFIWSNKEERIKRINVYVTNDHKMNIFIPNKFIVNTKDYKKSNEVLYSVKRFSRGLKKELMKVRIEKKQLESNINYLNMKLKKRQNQLIEYKENLNLAIEEKNRVDKNCKVFLEIQQKSKEELQAAKKKLEEQKVESEVYEDKLEKMKKDLLEKEEIIKRYKSTIKDLNGKLEGEKNEKIIIRNMLDKERTVNELIKKQIQAIIIEKERLLRDLEVERNQSIMDRLLKRKYNNM